MSGPLDLNDPELALDGLRRTAFVRHPLCKGICGVGAETPRASHDSPAKPGVTPDGKKCLYCPCCETRLVVAEEGQDRSFAPRRPPNLRPELTARHRRFTDTICQYDVELLKNIEAL